MTAAGARGRPDTVHAAPAAVGLPAVRAIDLVKDHGAGGRAVRALDHVSLAVPPGRFVAVMGPSGSGKSTLLHCLAGLERPSSGRVVLGDTDLGRLDDRDLTLLRRRRIGIVFQAFNLLPTLDALENILLPLSLAGTAVDAERLDEVLGLVGLEERLAHLPSELSGGQQQRVAVARALITSPDLVLADEPTGNLDTRSGDAVLGDLRAAVDVGGRTVVMVTHDPRAASTADEVVFLSDGQVVDRMEGPEPATVLDRLKVLEA